MYPELRRNIFTAQGQPRTQAQITKNRHTTVLLYRSVAKLSERAGVIATDLYKSTVVCLFLVICAWVRGWLKVLMLQCRRKLFLIGGGGGGVQTRDEGPRKFLNLESLKSHFLDSGEDLKFTICLQFSSTKWAKAYLINYILECSVFIYGLSIITQNSIWSPEIVQ